MESKENGKLLYNCINKAGKQVHNMDILKAIPSFTVREYVLEHNWQFTDRQKAVIIYHSILPLRERIEMLRELAAITENGELKEQITPYLTYIEKALRLFENNDDRRFVYKVVFLTEDYNKKTGFCEPYDDYCEGCFVNLGDAVKYAVEYNEYEQWEAVMARGERGPRIFRIKKCMLFDKFDKNENSFYEHSVSTGWDDINRELIDLLEREVPEEEQYEESRENFTLVYEDMPNPFELGDIVKYISRYRRAVEIQIINTSRKDWEEGCAHIKSTMDRAGWDYSDIMLTTSVFTPNGSFSHTHENPLFLEKVTLSESDPRKAVIEVAASTVCGRSSLDWLGYHLEEYLSSSRS